MGFTKGFRKQLLNMVTFDISQNPEEDPDWVICKRLSAVASKLSRQGEAYRKVAKEIEKVNQKFLSMRQPQWRDNTISTVPSKRSSNHSQGSDVARLYKS